MQATDLTKYKMNGNEKTRSVVRTFDIAKVAGYTPPLSLYNCVIDSYGQIGDLQRVSFYYSHLRSAGLAANRRTYHLMVMGYCSRNESTDALRWWRMMREEGFYCYPVSATTLPLL